MRGCGYSRQLVVSGGGLHVDEDELKLAGVMRWWRRPAKR
jgi:hypothetical protein